ncbi:MAG: hypothetical protein LBB61_07440 [Treponema sp.]|nr:hypothetical protein [Treponema sp.]
MNKIGRFGFIAVVAIVVIIGCGGRRDKTVQFSRPFPVPPIEAEGEETQDTAHHPIFVYWSQTRSERGYILNRQGKAAPPLEFVHFLTSFNETLRYGYLPSYYLLEKQNDGFIQWKEIDAKYFNPAEEAFYNAISGGNFRDERGPLMMLYDKGLVKADDLTVVVSDLEEQNLNNTVLAGDIRNHLLISPRNAAAIIALMLPFNGENYKPDPNNINNMIEQEIYGDKPLYIIVTGLKAAVERFVKNYSAIARREGVETKIVSTMAQANDVKKLKVSNVIIPPSAGVSDNTKVNKNKKVLNDLWNIRNSDTGSPDRIWNLRDNTPEMVNYLAVPDASGALVPVKSLLDLKLLQYKAIKGSDKSGGKLWQLNIEFPIPSGYAVGQFVGSVENYRYLLSAPQPADADDGEKKSKKGRANKSSSVSGVWSEPNEARLKSDLEVSTAAFSAGSGNAGIYVAPRDKKTGALESPVISFDVVVALKRDVEVSIPAWVDDFNDNDRGGQTKGKTWNFKAFVGLVLGLDADLEPKSIENEDEFLRVPVITFDMPSRLKE